MPEDFDRAKDLFEMNKRVFAVVGVWPLQSANAKFAICFVYQVAHTAAGTADFFANFGNMYLMMLNISENGWNFMVILKMLVIRFSRTLVDLTERIIDDVDSKSFENSEEKKIYLNYNRVAKKFFKLWVLMGFVASIAVHVKPLEVFFRAGSQNESVIPTLPYRMRLFFDIDDASTFWLMWAYQLPVIYLNTFHTATIGYLFSLILHVCGQMSVLAFRIRRMDENYRGNEKSSKTVFHDIVSKHQKILGMVKDINRVFGLLLLEELLISTLLIGLAAYNVILTVDSSNKTLVIASLLEVATILLLIWGYCVAGAYLIAESENLYEAFYQCRWYDMSGSFRKQLIICMIGACKPLQLMGGDFYVFSLDSFTNVSANIVHFNLRLFNWGTFYPRNLPT